MTRDMEEQPLWHRLCYGSLLTCAIAYTSTSAWRAVTGVPTRTTWMAASGARSLLLSCRTLYAEVATLLYSANQFVIFYSHEAALGPLHALSSTAVSSLTSLKIGLNECSCHHRVDSHNFPPPCCYGDVDVEHEPRPNSDRAHCAKHHGSAILTTWHEAAVHLCSHVSAGRLALSLVCDIDHQHEYAREAGQLVVAPLAPFPPLKDCHVRLCKQWDRPLQQLAESAVRQACPRPSPLRLAPAKVPSLLVNLPRELRLLILEYTDLVTTWTEVTWCRRYRRYQVCQPSCLDSEGECQPFIHHGCRLNRCLGADPKELLPPSPGSPPTSLFLLCRTLYRDAQLVFFSRNRFIVHGVQAFPFWALPPIQDEARDPGTASNKAYYLYNRLATSDFLRDAVPTDCLAHLRFLELVFPPYMPGEWPVGKHPAILVWRDTVNWLRGKIDALALTIRVVFADFLYDPAASRKGTTKDEGWQIMKGYKHIIHPLKPLVEHDGLAALYVQAAFPWAWARDTVRQRDPGDDWRRGLRRQQPDVAGI
ncbi:uncharacterized protein B0T15DRAFT_486437 [Chaetomium strumarium]|uniref:Uncharacterized protein n=1 Tax=Chaetomium strumarium TaxID=1170767 RepID=A0AAJ0GMU4_9PEZI|nr:hypothetical protein B0T15DRAFT_486437 [Chaetomium strumarium]